MAFYSDAPKSSKDKPAWGNITEISLVRDRNKENNVFEYFLINNGQEQRRFKAEQLTPVLGKVTPFGHALLQINLDHGFQVRMRPTLLIRISKF